MVLPRFWDMRWRVSPRTVPSHSCTILGNQLGIRLLYICSPPRGVVQLSYRLHVYVQTQYCYSCIQYYHVQIQVESCESNIWSSRAGSPSTSCFAVHGLSYLPYRFQNLSKYCRSTRNNPFVFTQRPSQSEIKRGAIGVCNDPARFRHNDISGGMILRGKK